jgi:hypothetical protein
VFSAGLAGLGEIKNTRKDVTRMSGNKLWFRAVLTLTIALLVIAAAAGCAPKEAAPSAERAAASKALNWLRSQQQEDGSFNVGFGHPAGVTCDAVLAIVANGDDPATWRTAEGKPSLVDYLATHASEYATDAATTGKLIVTIAAAGLKPTDFGGADWMALLHSFSDGKGTYDPGAVGQAWAIMALQAAGEQVPPEALTALKGYQLETGAWNSAFGPDNDTVGYVLQALIAGGEPKSSAAIQKALDFYATQQNDDGGFPAIKPSEWGTDTNANSTASVIMGLIAAGETPAAGKWIKSGNNPLSALLLLQTADGKIEFQPGVGSPVMATVQAIPAILSKALPMRPAK